MKKIKTTTRGKEIEKILEEGKSVLTSSLKKKMELAARNTQSERGGSRLGAGRPQKEYVKTNLLLTPEARTKIERMVKEKKATSMSAAVNKLILG